MLLCCYNCLMLTEENKVFRAFWNVLKDHHKWSGLHSLCPNTLSITHGLIALQHQILLLILLIVSIYKLKYTQLQLLTFVNCKSHVKHFIFYSFAVQRKFERHLTGEAYRSLLTEISKRFVAFIIPFPTRIVIVSPPHPLPHPPLSFCLCFSHLRIYISQNFYN